MRPIFTCFLILAGSLNLVQAQAVQKVLIEEFTGAWCGFCPDGALVLTDILDNDPNAIGVSIHNGDAMVTTNGTYVENFFSPSFPQAVFNRNGAPISRSSWASTESSISGGSAPASISFDSWTYNALTREVSITVKAEFFTTEAGQFRMNLGFTEDNVTGTGSGYDQVNYFNTTSGHPLFGLGNPIIGYAHNHVLRAYVSGAWGAAGSVPSTITPGLISTYTFNYTLPASWDINELNVVAWVGRYNGIGLTQRSILNAEEIPFSIIDATDESLSIPTDLKVYPNPGRDRINCSFRLSKTGNIRIDVLDVTGKVVASLTEGMMNAGVHTHTWIPGNVPAGMYLIRIQSDAGECQTVRVQVAE